jgi:hypothetical protein
VTSDGETTRPGLAGEGPDRPAAPSRRYRPQRRTNEPHGPCRYCGGLGDAHKLTCRLLRLPDEDEGEPLP